MSRPNTGHCSPAEAPPVVPFGHDPLPPSDGVSEFFGNFFIFLFIFSTFICIPKQYKLILSVFELHIHGVILCIFSLILSLNILFVKITHVACRCSLFSFITVWYFVV